MRTAFHLPRKKSEQQLIEALGCLEMDQMPDAVEDLDARVFHLRRQLLRALGDETHALAVLGLGERFAGRGVEFRTLVGLLDDAVTGSPRAVAILGEAGAGTAALVRRLEPEVRLRGGSS